MRAAGSERRSGVKTELKNLNSFRFLEQGVSAEIARQEDDPERGRGGRAGDAPLRPGLGRDHVLRSKEEAHDYRYFPEPDLLPVAITEEMVAERPRGHAASCRRARAERFERELGLSSERARALAFRRELGDYFERALEARRRGRRGAPAQAQTLANLVAVELPPRIGATTIPARSPVTPAALVALVGDGRAQADQRRRGAARCSTSWSPRAATRREIVEREGLAGDRRGR